MNFEWVARNNKMNDLRRPEVNVGRKKKVISFCEQLAEQSIYLAEPEVCFWCLLPVNTLEHWVCGQLPSGGLTIHCKTSLLEDHAQFVSS